MGDHGLGCTGHGDDDQVGGSALDQPVMVDAEDGGAAVRRGVEGELYVVVAAERVAVRHVHRALEHVAGTVGTPEVADAVVPAGDGDAGRTEQLQRGDREVVHRGRDDGDASLGQPCGAPLLHRGRCLAERVSMADRHPALQPKGDGSLADQVELPEAEAAAVVQVQVEPGAVPLDQAEHGVEVAHRVAVHAGRVDPADHCRARVEGGVEEVGGAGRGDDAVLGEGDLLDGHQVGQLRRHGRDHLDAAQPDLWVDVGVGAHVRRARGHHRPQQLADALLARDTELMPTGPVVRDPFRQRVPRRVRLPREAGQGLVEMAVRLDQPGQHQAPGDVDHLRSLRSLRGLRVGDGRSDPRHRPVAHEHVTPRPVTPRIPAAQEEVTSHAGQPNAQGPGRDWPADRHNGAGARL